MTAPVKITMDNLATFAAAGDYQAQLLRVREIHRQQGTAYRPPEDFWSYFREDLMALHVRGGSVTDATVRSG